MTAALLAVAGTGVLLVVVAMGALALAGQQIGIAHDPTGDYEAAVVADDQLLDQLGRGDTLDPPSDDDLELYVRALKRWRDESGPGPGDSLLRQVMAAWDEQQR